MAKNCNNSNNMGNSENAYESKKSGYSKNASRNAYDKNASTKNTAGKNASGKNASRNQTTDSYNYSDTPDKYLAAFDRREGGGSGRDPRFSIDKSPF